MLTFLRIALPIAARSAARWPTARLTALAATESGTSQVARAVAHGRRLYAKLRVDPRDDARGEAAALSALARSDLPVPELLGRTTVREVLSTLARDGRWAELEGAEVRGGGLLVLGEVPGRARARLSSDELLALGRLLAKVHQVPCSSRSLEPLSGGATAPGMVRYLEACLDVLAGAGLLTARDLTGLRRRVAEARRHVEGAWLDTDVVRRVLCHGDVRPANILVATSGLGLIDFQHAGMADPMVDLMRAVAYCNLGRHEELCLLHAYAEQASLPHLERYFLYRPLGPLFAALSAARWLAEVHAGRALVREGWLARRRAFVEQQLSGCLGQQVRLVSPAPRPYRGIVAVDGMAGSGKSPLAALLARRLSVPHLNTGAAYRLAALWALRLGLSPDRPADVQALARRLRQARLSLTPDGRVRVGGRVLSLCLELPAVEASVAQWAQKPEVRAALGPHLARAVSVEGAVVEGRDVKSVLCPHARASFYVRVSPQARSELLGLRGQGDHAVLLAQMTRRDRLDRERAAAPARVPKGAVVLSGGAQLPRLAQRVLERLGR